MRVLDDTPDREARSDALMFEYSRARPRGLQMVKGLGMTRCYCVRNAPSPSSATVGCRPPLIDALGVKD